jgi:adenylate kinase
MNIVLVGPPGVGKGTQAAAIAQATGLAHIASGDLFRQSMRERTRLGSLARSYVDRGELVPDEIVIDMVLARIAEPDCERGVILDGFPRTEGQAQRLGEALAEQDRRIDSVVILTAPQELLLRRIIGRQTCQLCGAAYNVYYTPSRHETACDLCGGDLVARSDDTVETARHRFEVYVQQTAPLVAYYRDLGLAREVDATGDVDGVTSAVLSVLGGGDHAPSAQRSDPGVPTR